MTRGSHTVVFCSQDRHVIATTGLADTRVEAKERHNTHCEKCYPANRL